MLRRDFLNQLSVACAGAPLVLAIASCSQSSLSVRTPLELARPQAPSLADGQVRMVAGLAEGIIPATDTPGAIGAGVPEFLALLYSDWFLPEQQSRFAAGLAALDAETMHRYGQEFIQLSPERQSDMLTRWDEQAFSTPSTTTAAEFFRWFKKLTVIGYYTSEIGQLEELKARFGAGQDTPAGPILEPPPFQT